MARKRLYGETQKRRKKKQTQELKRQNSVTRVQSTHQPAPFQRSGEVSSQDVAFMEAMRDMGVSRYPRTGEAPVRQEKFETVQFAAGEEDEDSFLATMESLGVRPMTGKREGRPSRPGGTPAGGQATATGKGISAAEAGPRAAARANTDGRELTGGTSKPPPAAELNGMPEPVLAAERKDTSKPPPVAELNDTSKPPPVAELNDTSEPAAESGDRAQRARPATTFQLGGDDARMMAEALRDGEFDPKAKFEGAPPLQDKRPAKAAIRNTAQRAASPQGAAFPQGEYGDREPDAELDLHGKTQEEAIRMVQNFLLTSYHRKLRHVLIITGKGHKSGAAGPVLREAVFHWLERNSERFARSFAWAPARHGGDGAIWVVLR